MNVKDMWMPLPSLSPEQRAAALAAAAGARTERAELTDDLTSGRITLADLFLRAETSGIAGKLRVSAVLAAALGNRRADQMMAQLGIDDSRRVLGLSAEQRAAIVAATSEPHARPAPAVASPAAEAPVSEPSFAPEPQGVVFTDSVGALACWVPLELDDERSVAVSGGADGTVRTWDLTSGRQITAPLAGGPIGELGARAVETIVVHESSTGPVLAVHYATDYGASSGIETEFPVRWVDPLTGRPVPPGGAALAEASGDVPAAFAAKVTAPVTALLAIPGSYPRVASTHQDAADSPLWDPATGARVAAMLFPLPAMPVLIPYDGKKNAGRRDIPYGPLIAGVTGANEVVVKDIDGNTVCGPFRAHEAAITTLLVFALADGRPVLATTGTTPGSVIGPLPDLLRLWDPYTGDEIALPGTTHCYDVTVLPTAGGDLLAATTDEGPLRIFDPSGDTDPDFATLHISGALVALRGPAGRPLIAATSEDRVEIHDLSTGEHVRSFAEVYPSRLMAVPRADGTDALVAVDNGLGLTASDPWTGQLLAERMTGHTTDELYEDAPLAVVFPGAVVTGGADGTIRRWDLPIG